MKYLMLLALAASSLSSCAHSPKIADARIEYPPAPEILMRPPLELQPIVVPKKTPNRE